MSKLVSIDHIEHKIYLIRGRKVMLDKDLAQLYDVPAIRLREQVKRNKKRFPSDFIFQLDDKEVEFMVSQNAIPSRKHLGGFKPYVFTEQGVAMLSGILNSDRAIEVNIAIMRAFVRMREFFWINKELNEKLEALERKVGQHDKDIIVIFNAIRKLMAPAEQKPAIGFYVQSPAKNKS